MKEQPTGRHSFALIISLALHVTIAFTLIGLPSNLKRVWDKVDIEIAQAPPKDEPLPTPEPMMDEPEPEPLVPPIQPKRKIDPPPIEPRPEPQPEIPDEPPPPDVEEAPPVFDLGDNTFAKNGQGAGWNLARSEGNTRFAPVQRSQKSVRGTAPRRVEPTTAKAEAAVSFKPVPQADWSRKPEPIEGGNAMPEYPFEAKRDGVEGKVLIQVFIGKDGQVKKARILSDPGKGLGEASQKHALQKKWRPALDKNGNPVDTIMIWTYTFILDS